MVRYFFLVLCLGIVISSSTRLAVAQQPSEPALSQSLAQQSQQVIQLADAAKYYVAQSPDLKTIHGISLPFFEKLTIAGKEGDYFAFNPSTDTSSEPVTAGYKFWDDARWTSLPAYSTSGQGSNRTVDPNSLILLPAGVDMFLVEFRFGSCSVPKSSPDVNDFLCKTPQPPSDDNAEIDCCQLKAIFLRNLRDAKNNLIPAVVLSKDKMLVSEALIRDSQDWAEDISTDSAAVGIAAKPRFTGTFTIDGYSVAYYFPNSRGQENSVEIGLTTYVENSGWAIGDFHEFGLYPAVTSCRPFDPHDQQGHNSSFKVKRPPSDDTPPTWKDNGIRQLGVKVYDVFSLRQLLATTASQLSTITGFNGTSITNAIGSTQGVTSDISYLNAQATTVATPTISSVTSNGNTGSNTIGGTANVTSALSGSNTSINCPAGTLPGVGTSGLPACVLVVNSSSPGGTTSANPVGFTGAGNTNGGVSTVSNGTTNSGTNLTNSSTNVLGTSQTATNTVNSGGQSGTIAAIPVSNAPSAPNNVNQSASDILTEQVQLNSQITTLRMALQGALSDQYLVKEGKVVSTRKQTTLGLNVYLDPQDRYKHAVAEIRVWVYPARDDDSISIVNLLPVSKTYNVAKVTSNQKAFGAGVVIDPINIGVAVGKTKNRLYLAKDTDTVALQYYPKHDDTPESWHKGAIPVGRSAQDHIVDFARLVQGWQSISDACADDPGPLLQNPSVSRDADPLVFGWQFRPVLGASDVVAGNRQLFAQLALPVAQGTRFSPLVFIQTRWREYDAKRQVVGPVYSGSCSVIQDPDVIEVDSPLEVHNVGVDDMGGGIVKVSAEGRFFQQGFSVLSGPNTIGPATFDGQNVQFFANAANLLLMDDLKLAAEDGTTTSLGVRPVKPIPQECGITSADMIAVPQPDGSSLVQATIHTGSYYNLRNDSAPHPLFLVGSQVYGLHETPFVAPAPDSCHATNPLTGAGPVTCVYHFIAPIDSIRAAQTFTARDLSWRDFKKTGSIDFDPSFSGLTVVASESVPDSNNITIKPKGAASPRDVKPTSPDIYSLSGTDLQRVLHLNCNTAGCLELYQGFTPFTLSADNFQHFSKTNAVLTLQTQASQPYFKASAKPCNPCAITITEADAGSTTFYTNDGSEPDENSTPYASPFQAHAGQTIKAVAFTPNQRPSSTSKLSITNAGAIVGAIQPVQMAKFSYKSYRFIWHPNFGGQPVEWDLAAPPKDTATVSASQVLNEEDVTDITFSGVDVFNDKTTMNFSFNGLPIANPSFKYDGSKKTLTFYITSDMTYKLGHKVILLNAVKQGSDGKQQPTQVLLPFDVTRR